MEYVYYIATIVMGLLIILLLVLNGKATKEKKEAEKKLSETLDDLENVYSEINNTQEELNAKYREIKASEDKIKKLAYEDALTGMPNKAAFNEMLRHTLETLRKNEAAGIMYVDLDDFKKLDDLWGHVKCDEFILDVSHRLRQNLDEDDYIARMDGDGDGFMVLSQNLKDTSEYDKKIKRLSGAFRFPFITSFGEAVITLSIGATITPKDGEKAGTLLKNAALALEEAKRLGKDTYCYYSEDLAEREIEHIEFKSSLSTAIKNDSFMLKYEPVIDLTTRRCDRVRVKLLWDREEKGVVNAKKFIRIVEHLGLSTGVGINCLRKLCADMRMFPDKKVIVPLTENMFLNYEFKKQLIETIDENRLDFSRFIIEIDESVLTSRFSDSFFMMEELIQKGFGFIVGGYGNGKRSMDILRELPIKGASLQVQPIFRDHEEEESKKYLSLIIHVLNTLDISTIFTDISDSVTEDHVIGNGGRFVQGELYGGAISAKEVSEYGLLE